jgi:hypothetical protein
MQRRGFADATRFHSTPIGRSSVVSKRMVFAASEIIDGWLMANGALNLPDERVGCWRRTSTPIETNNRKITAMPKFRFVTEPISLPGATQQWRMD